MQDITVNVKELAAIIEENRDAHRAIFVAAWHLYTARAEEELKSRLADLQRGRGFVLRFDLPVPEDHTEDYNRVLKMLELHTEDTIVLAEGDVAMYVQDDWAWTRAWRGTTASYLVT